MTELQLLIQAFKTLDFDALNMLMDDNRPYMEVPKALFLSRLKQELDVFPELTAFEHVVEGISASGKKDCKAYRFFTEGLPALILLFEVNDGRVKDIQLRYDMADEPFDEKGWNFYFYFFEEEKVNFSPSIDYQIHVQKINLAVEEYHQLASSGLVDIHGVVYWHQKHKFLAERLKLNERFASVKFKAFKNFHQIYSKVSELVHNYENHHIAQEALIAYDNLNKDEESIVRWLITNNDAYFFPLKQTDKWETTGLLILVTEPDLLVDCTGYLDAYHFFDTYYKHLNAIMKKYYPKPEHFDQNGGSVTYSLESFLKLHNMYLDLL